MEQETRWHGYRRSKAYLISITIAVLLELIIILFLFLDLLQFTTTVATPSIAILKDTNILRKYKF
jgi:hypothetical protein